MRQLHTWNQRYRTNWIDNRIIISFPFQLTDLGLFKKLLIGKQQSSLYYYRCKPRSADFCVVLLTKLLSCFSLGVLHWSRTKPTCSMHCAQRAFSTWSFILNKKMRCIILEDLKIWKSTHNLYIPLQHFNWLQQTIFMTISTTSGTFCLSHAKQIS